MASERGQLQFLCESKKHLVSVCGLRQLLIAALMKPQDAFVGMYPMSDYVIFSDEAYTETFEYLYNQRAHGLRHCVTCGVMVFMIVYGPPDLVERLKNLEEQDHERYKVVKKIAEGKLKLQPVNLRTLERVDWYGIRQRIERTDVGTEGYVLVD